MEIKILTKNDSELYFPEILEMLKRADGEFVPPLSSRSSTTQSSLVGNASTPEGILLYFEEMKKQRLAVALENGELVAFMSYRENYLTDTVTEVPNVYLSTLIVKPEGRGKGLTQIMYGELFKAYPDRCVYTRTWSTNVAHTKILSRLGFDILKVIENDRGEGIDTVYFVKRGVK
ncbi:MAG: GNAT family N-acetyltransferase [Clostridia bacterium]|nr:GNAT family N-acetyltransferase [Clostridia bacterium]